MALIRNKIRITGKFAGYFSIAGNLALFIFKLWAGILTGSVAIVADAWHTLSDSLSSLILLFGLHYTYKPADKEHPYGHGRAEIIASLVLGLILVLVAINFLYGSITNILEKETVKYSLFAIIITAVSIVVKEIMAQISFSAARNEKYNSIRADGLHHRSDALTSAVILAGIFFGTYFWWIDGALGIFVSVMILVLGYQVIRDSISPLLGEKPDDEVLEKIRIIGQGIYAHDMHIHHINIHRYGNHTELTFHIKLPGNIRLEEANRITSAFIERIKEDLNIFTTIYIDAYSDPPR
jgi:cation diffusion facilitator family transporter